MKYLITGGAGFIGSHLAAKLLSQHHQVSIVDNFSTGSINNLTPIILENVYAPSNFAIHNFSILEKDRMAPLVQDCDVVVHLAAAVGVKYIIDHPLESIQTNIVGTENVLDLCNRFKKQVFIASTSEVYGKHKQAHLKETDDCIYGPSTKTRWSYAAAKLIDEFTSLAYHQQHSLPVVVARFFNIVGPRQTGQYGMVLPRFVQSALLGKPIQVYGDGTQTRTFTHVNDAIEAMLRLLACTEANGQVVNIGGVEEISMLALAERVRDMVGNPAASIQLIPYDQAYPSNFEDMQRRVPSTEKLFALTQFKPQIELNQIIQDVIGYFKQAQAMGSGYAQSCVSA